MSDPQLTLSILCHLFTHLASIRSEAEKLADSKHCHGLLMWFLQVSASMDQPKLETSLASSILLREHGRHHCKQAAITPGHRKYQKVTDPAQHKFTNTGLSSNPLSPFQIRGQQNLRPKTAPHSIIDDSAVRIQGCIYVAISNLPTFQVPLVSQTNVLLRIPNVGISLLVRRTDFSFADVCHPYRMDGFRSQEMRSSVGSSAFVQVRHERLTEMGKGSLPFASRKQCG